MTHAYAASQRPGKMDCGMNRDEHQSTTSASADNLTKNQRGGGFRLNLSPLMRPVPHLLRVLLRQEGFVLAAVLVAIVSLWSFVELTEEVLEGSTHAFDHWVILQLRRADNPAIPIGPSWLRRAGEEVTALGGVAVLWLIVLAVVGYLLQQRAYRALGLIVGATAGGSLLSSALKYLFVRERPDVALHLVTVHSSSFPSGHAMLSAVVYLTLGALLAQVVPRRANQVYFLTVALVLTLLVGLSRIYLGVHYPTDVLAGWAVGLTWALLCAVVARYLRRRGTIQPPEDSQTTD
jgi:undecaprenyl-diphosphatase